MYASLDLVGAFVVSLSLGMALVLVLFRRQPAAPAGRAAAAEIDGTSFLFDGDDLTDATSGALRLLADLPPGRGGTDWADLVFRLERQFPGLGDEAGRLEASGRCRLAGRGGDTGLEIERWDGMTRLTIFRPGGDMVPVHPVTLDLMEQDVALLGLIAEEAPLLIWRTDADGRIAWANRAYLDLADACATPGAPGNTWPPATLFAAAPAAVGPDRLELRTADGSRRWFDLHVRSAAGGRIWIACAADALVASERMASSFVQTLSKTFADLAVGLAIFDRQRRLVMFNPALTDLTGLPVDLLAGRPSIRSFLDALRARDRLPEPKDYVSWRAEVAALEAAAAQGSYRETWTLTGGQTFRVTGRPHPDGALAFLFEDISAEVALSRQYRADLATRAAALDLVDEAVAVFSAAGRLRISNAGYDEAWGRSAEGLADIRLADEVEAWRAACAPCPVWERLSRGATTDDDLSTAHPLRRLDGRSAELRLSRLPGGDLAVRFRIGPVDGVEDVTERTRPPGRRRAAAG